MILYTLLGIGGIYIDYSSTPIFETEIQQMKLLERLYNKYKIETL